MLVNMERNRIRDRLEGYPEAARFTVCTSCWNIVHSVRGGDVVNNGSGYCKETVEEVSKEELLKLLQ